MRWLKSYMYINNVHSCIKCAKDSSSLPLYPIQDNVNNCTDYDFDGPLYTLT